jgi:DNA-binding SARP family transcriptional activator
VRTRPRIDPRSRELGVQWTSREVVVPRTGGTSLQISLLGDFSVRVDDEPVPCSWTAQQVVACLALRGPRLEKASLVATLWPDEDPRRGRARLRTVGWELRHRLQTTPLQSDRASMWIKPEIRVDVHDTEVMAKRLVVGSVREIPPLELLSQDILERWECDWIYPARESFRHLRIQAMEQLCRYLIEEQQYAAAVEVAVTALVSEPFRESIHRCLIEAHLSQGNNFDALRQYRGYFRAMADVGVSPSPLIRSLIEPILQRSENDPAVE